MTDWNQLREDFLVTRQGIYLDNGAKVPIAQPVWEAINDMLNLCRERGRDYDKWWQTADAARGLFADLIGAEAEEIAYAGSSTAAVNVIAQGLHWEKGDNVVVAAQEFPSNLYPWLKLRERGVEIRLAEPDEFCALPLKQYADLCDEHTRLIAVSHVQAGTGFRTNLWELGSFCRQRNIRFFVDATQSCGVFPIDVKGMHIDFLCASTYKWMMGMDGLAVLFCASDRLSQVGFTYLGWSGRTDRNDYEHHTMEYPQEARRFELGNLNFTAIGALYAALKYHQSIGLKNIEKRTVELMEALKEGLREVPGLHLIGDFPADAAGAIVTVQCSAFPEIHRKLLKDNIYTSLKYNGIRFSPYFYNTFSEIDTAVNVLKGYIGR